MATRGRVDITETIELWIQLDNQRTAIPGGETLVALRQKDTTDNYLDFGDNTFKTVGHGTKQAQLAELDAVDSPGYYRREVDLGALTGLPAAGKSLVAEYQINATSPTLDIGATDVWELADGATNISDIVAAILAAVLAGSGESVDDALSRLDNIDADVATTIPGLIAALNDLSIADVQTAMTAQGYTSARAPNLDNLDVAVSTRAVPGDAMALTAAAITAIDTELTTAHGAGAWTSLSQQHFDLRQGWSRKLTPTSEMRGVVHLEANGNRVTLPGPAACTFQAYDRAGAAIAGFSGSGTLRTVGSDTYFDLSAAYSPTTGEVITVQVTITGSGVGSGTHVGMTEIAFPEF